MKTTILLPVIVLTFLLGSCSNSSSEKNKPFVSIDTSKMKTGDAYYQCEMHPEVISDKPGTCYKCEGMELGKIVKQ